MKGLDRGQTGLTVFLEVTMTEKNVILDISTQRRAELEVLFQEEVQLDINVPLFYIKSGEEDINNYVERTAKPAIDAYVEEKNGALEQAARDGVEAIGEAQEEAKSGLEVYVDGTVKPVIDTYAETAVKPELQSFADELKEAFDTNAAEKTAAVNALAEQASASASSAASSSSAAQTAASAAANSANEALKSADNAAAAASNAADYASQAEDSAGAAKTSETNAESSEMAASGSAETAASSAASASESKEAAAASATAVLLIALVGIAAEAFKTAAESAATVANEKAAAVSESALAAAESATAAASAADTAEAWAVGSIEERPEGSAKYWAEKINPDNLADVDLSNLSSAGNAKLPLPWSSFQARNMLANGSIAKDQVRTFTLNYLTNDRLYEVIGSVFFTSNGVVTIRCSSNPVIADAMVSNPVAGTFIATDSSRGAGTFTALVKNKTIRFSNTGSVTATGVYINVAAFREVGD